MAKWVHADVLDNGINHIKNNAVRMFLIKAYAAGDASSGAGPDLHFAFTDGASKVLWVTDESTDVVVTSGNTINFPALTYLSSQPT